MSVTTEQAVKIFGNAICRKSAGTPKSRVAERQKIAAAQVAVLQDAIATLRNKARETPAWAHGYNSAITALEIQIEQIKRAA